MRLFRVICIGLFITMALAGCWDKKEIGEVNYATAIGIDYVDNNYILYVQLLDFSNVAKQEGGKLTEVSPLYIGKGSGTTFQDAVNDIYQTSQQSINWGQIGAIIYSESMLVEGIEKVEQAIGRDGEFRYTPWMFGTNESIEEIFGLSGFFHLPPIYTILYKPKATDQDYAYIKPLRMYRFNAIYKDKGGTSLLPSISIETNAWKQSVGKEETKKILKIDGVFPVNEGKYRQWMSQGEVSGLKWIDTKTANTSVKVISNEKDMGTVEVMKPSARIEVVDKGETTKFNISIKAKGQLTGLQEKMSASEIEQLVQKQIEKEIITTYRKGIDKNVDVYNLKNKLFHDGMNAEKVEAFHLTADSIENISVEFHLESKGISD